MRHEACCQWTTNIVASLRNIVHSQSFEDKLVDTKFLEFMFEVMKRLPLVREVTYNILRILSKLSSTEGFCKEVSVNRGQIDQLISLMHQFKENNFVIMRTSYILANLTAFQEEVAVYVYFNDEGIIF